MGSGALFYRDDDDEDEDGGGGGGVFRREFEVPCALDRQEGAVAQFLALEGWKRFLRGREEDGGGRRLICCMSAVHAGPGQQCLAFNHRDKTDATLALSRGNAGGPAALIFYNFNGGFFHYLGHEPGCRKRVGSLFIEKNRDRLEFGLRTEYARRMSAVRPADLEIEWARDYGCKYFDGNLIERFKDGDGGGGERPYFDLRELLRREYPYEAVCRPDPFRGKRRIVQRDIVAGILDGSLTGFVHLSGGEEKPDFGAAGKFGFCVQKYAPRARQLGPYTLELVKKYMGFKTDEATAEYCDKAQPRALNSTSFHSKETVSTSYLKWLIERRGLSGFVVHHFIYYPFRDYKREFMEPLLQRRHECKLAGKHAEAEALKLVANGNFGFNGIQAVNYNDTRIISETGLVRSASAKYAAENVMRINIIGLADVKARRRAVKAKRAARNRKKKKKKAAAAKGGGGGGDEFEFLLCVTSSGKKKAIRNTIAQAVSTLSNSKVIFLSNVETMLDCLDPELAELCYTDTDSCIWSTSFPDLEKCLLPEKLDEWRRADIIADENGPLSCHGKMKLEGVHARGVFKTVKIYRLYSRAETADGGDGDDGDGVYTRCKGISRNAADQLKDQVFTDSTGSWATEKTNLMPSDTHEIVIRRETRNLAVPFNMKRYVTADGLHTLPVSHVSLSSCSF